MRRNQYFLLEARIPPVLVLEVANLVWAYFSIEANFEIFFNIRKLDTIDNLPKYPFDFLVVIHCGADHSGE